ncbi:lactonase family protein [Micromonospora echinofusca]|uniref:Beta-propeller fold lactonase family protein n=1 Tax=Micromonospora echinofusca TaxID=47858 RepID=A0ABS3W145_MICEH|nr:lactonase family protein [Micromonospora echinofusca]MBO4210516.1 beta-propeller fold lactonase family protein [Micromonospora echinofusca]
MSDRGGLVHIGCYTPATGGRGAGIVLARRDPVGGALTVLGTAAVTDSPSFLARHPGLDVLYAVNELPDGTVSAFRVAADGGLTPLGVRSTGGDSPCHLAVAPDGRHLYVANYGSGSVSVHPLDASGVPGDHTDLLAHSGHGADPERQDRAHAHMVSPDPADGSVLAVDLGTDSVYRYELEPASGRLVPLAPRLRTPAGTGPRHLARHPDGRRAYLVGELDATLTGYDLHPGGVLHERHRVPASDRTGRVHPSEVSVAPDGRFCYVANRGVGTLAVFALVDDQPPRLVTEVATGGGWPRHFARADDHLYVADERAHLVRVFRVDPVTGIPTPVGEPVEVPSPVCVLP